MTTHGGVGLVALKVARSLDINSGTTIMLHTAASLRALPARDAAYTVTVESNLKLAILPSGRKTWRVAYRLHGARRQIVVGEFPDKDLDAARLEAATVRRHIAAGRDPVAGRKVARIKAAVAAGNTF